MLARLAVLHQSTAPRAALPALRLGELVGAAKVTVLGAVRTLVGGPAAYGTRRMVARARSDAAASTELVCAQPDATLGLVTVDALPDRSGPLPSAGLESVTEVGLDAGIDGGKGDLVEAALGGPLLFVLEGVGNETGEAVTAVAVAGGLDHGVRKKFVKAGDAFSVRLSAICSNRMRERIDS